MTDTVSAGVASATEAASFGQLSTLLRELARAPPSDVRGAWQRRLVPGDVVGRFEILREIGRGGFGVVYEALDRQLGRSVAFKTLRPSRTGHELSEDWLLREAEAVACLDHRGVVTRTCRRISRHHGATGERRPQLAGSFVSPYWAS